MAPSPKDSSTSRLLEGIATAHELMRANMIRYRSVQHEEPLHDMRVAIRKLRSLLACCAACGLLPRRADRIRRDLHTLFSETGELRDIDTAFEAFEHRRTDDTILQPLAQRRGRLRDLLVRRLTGSHLKSIDRHIDRFLAKAAKRPSIDPGIALQTQRWVLQTEECAFELGVRTPFDLAMAHTLRKRCKRLRYLAETTGACDIASRCKTLQQQLGVILDHDLRHGYARQLGLTSHACEFLAERDEAVRGFTLRVPLFD